MSQILSATGGIPIIAGRKWRISGISIDTRTIKPGELYVAIIGKRLDGHNFIYDALRRSAAGVILSQWQQRNMNMLDTILSINKSRKFRGAGVWVVLVPDTTKALGDVAGCVRNQLSPKVIGIVGSNGKSTTKEMLAAILSQRYQVLKPRSSFNNDIGVPLTVLEMTPRTEAALIEMELNEFGGIRRLCQIAQPDIGVVTNIGDSHLESLGSRKGVAKEKSELLEYLQGKGTAVLNADDPLVTELGRRFPVPKTIRFGIGTKADLWAGNIEELGIRGCRFRLNDEYEVKLPVAGGYNVYNALAATGAALALGMTMRQAVNGLERFRSLPLRMQIERIGGIDFICDCYNANPQSMSAALSVLSKAQGRRIAVLGDMLELGQASVAAHTRLGRQACRAADAVVALGRFSGSVRDGAESERKCRVICVKDCKSAIRHLIDFARAGDTILIKGSRANRMEEIIVGIKRHYEENN